MAESLPATESGPGFPIEKEVAIHLDEYQFNSLKTKLGEHTEEVEYEVTKFSTKSICPTLQEGNVGICNGKLENIQIRIRKGTVKDGSIKYHWTIKKKLSKIDGIKTKNEREGYELTYEEALRTLAKELSEFINGEGVYKDELPTKEKIIITTEQITEIKLTVIKKRVSFIIKDEESGCNGTQIDMDINTHVNGKELDKPIYTVDIEGITDERIMRCVRSLGLIVDKKYSFTKLIKEKGII